MRCRLTARLCKCGLSIDLGSPQQCEAQVLVVHTGLPMPVLKEQHELLAVGCGHQPIPRHLCTQFQYYHYYYHYFYYYYYYNYYCCCCYYYCYYYSILFAQQGSETSRHQQAFNESPFECTHGAMFACTCWGVFA